MIWIKDTCFRERPNRSQKYRSMFSIFECPKCGSLIENPKQEGLDKKHCGCAKTIVHNTFERKLYASWAAMHTRCYVKSSSDYKYYGAKGIEVCRRWRRGEPYGFQHFIEDMGNSYFEKATMDRENSEGNYELKNCRWLTRSENSKRAGLGRPQSQEERDKRANSLIKIDIQKTLEIQNFLLEHTLEETSNVYGFGPSAIRAAFKRYNATKPVSKNLKINRGQAEEIKEFLKQGNSVEASLEKFNLAMSTLYDTFDWYGFEKPGQIRKDKI